MNYWPGNRMPDRKKNPQNTKMLSKQDIDILAGFHYCKFGGQNVS